MEWMELTLAGYEIMRLGIGRYDMEFWTGLRKVIYIHYVTNWTL
jgi:hypothetical protein